MTARVRCGWAEGRFPEYQRYHDEEWGVPVVEDGRQFEFLVLESAQAGLSWATILRRREHYRRAFHGFDPEAVAAFDSADEARLVGDSGIIRNRAKIRAAIGNARAFLEVAEEWGSFSRYAWSFVDYRPRVGRWRTDGDVPVSSRASDALTADMKARGFRFVGTRILYAHMQATGLVNDHLLRCFRRREILAGPAPSQRPGAGGWPFRK